MFEPNLAYDEEQLSDFGATLIREAAEIGYLRMARVVRGDVVSDTVKIQWSPDHLSYHNGGRPPESPEEMAEAALRWIRSQIEGNFSGGTQTFKLWAYAAKGDRAIVTKRVRVEDTGGEEPPEEPEQSPFSRDVSVSSESGILPPSAAAWSRLSQGYIELADGWRRLFGEADRVYGRLQRVILNGMDQIAQRADLDRAHLQRQVEGLHKQLAEIMTEFSAYKVQLLGLGVEVAGPARNAELNEKLGEKFIETVGGLGEAFFRAKNLSPSLAKLLKTFEEDAELAAILNDPDLPTLFEDASNRDYLKMLLKQALTNFKAKKNAPPPQSTPENEAGGSSGAPPDSPPGNGESNPAPAEGDGQQ